MAPLTETVVDELKKQIHSLEARIAELEGGSKAKESNASTSADGVRMILMGPPGAGKLSGVDAMSCDG
jgi:adenylate kinase